MAKFHILVPLDDSSFSRTILPSIVRMFNAQHTTVTLFRVGNIPEGVAPSSRTAVVASDGSLYSPEYFEAPPVYSSQVWDSTLNELVDSMEADMRYLKEAGFEVNRIAHFGDAADEIIDHVGSKAVDLVVMCTHGRSGLRRALMGSVAEKVLRQVSIPVMLLRPDEQPETRISN